MARGGGGNKKIFQYCTDSSGEILYLRALQGHSGRNLIDPSLQDNVSIPNDFFQYIYHLGCAINLHSIMNSGLILGGQNLSKRQTVFFTLVDPITRNTEIRTKLTWKHRVLHGTIRKSGRNIKTRCLGSTSNLLKRKDLSSMKHHRRPSSFTTRFQLIVSRRCQHSDPQSAQYFNLVEPSSSHMLVSQSSALVLLPQMVEQLLEVPKIIPQDRILQQTVKQIADHSEAKRADLAEAEKSLAALMASQAVSKSSYTQVASDHEASGRAFADELKALAEATVPGKFFKCCFADIDRSQRIRNGDNGQTARRAGALNRARSASRISAIMKFGAGAGDDPFVKCLITDLINRLQAEASSGPPRRRKILKPMLQSTLPNLKQLWPDPSFWTAKISALQSELRCTVKQTTAYGRHVCS